MADITSNLLLDWRLTEGSGSSVGDTSGSGNTGTLFNSPTWTTGPYTGLPAVSFNGSTQYLKTAAAINLSSYNAISIGAWVKFTDNNGTQVITELTNNYNNFTTGGLLYADTSGNAWNITLKGDVGLSTKGSSSAFTDWTNWHHVLGIFDKSLSSGEVALYVDGSSHSLNTSANNNNTNNFANDTLYWASRGGASLFDQCLLANPRVYGRALSSADAALLYAFQGGGTALPVITNQFRQRRE